MAKRAAISAESAGSARFARTFAFTSGVAAPLRKASEAAWKMRDPQLPKSKWYLTDAQFLGFRIVRPLKVPSKEEMERCWTSFPLPKP